MLLCQAAHLVSKFAYWWIAELPSTNSEHLPLSTEEAESQPPNPEERQSPVTKEGQPHSTEEAAASTEVDVERDARSARKSTCNLYLLYLKYYILYLVCIWHVFYHITSLMSM
jgi:hypothetical protein